MGIETEIEAMQSFMSDLDSLENFFNDRGDCTASEEAKSGVRQLKSDLQAFLAVERSLGAEKAAKQALGRLPKLSTRPDRAWSSKIYAARIDISYELDSLVRLKKQRNSQSEE